MKEIWKSIPNLSKYEISNMGRIKSIGFIKIIKGTGYMTKPKILKSNTSNSKGYVRLSLVDDNNIRKNYSVHRLVAIAFIDNPNNLPQVNHKDNNKLNNSINNLEWCTNSENMRHSQKFKKENGSYLKMSGEKCYMNKYSEDLIKQIPDVVANSYSLQEAAEKLGIGQTLISEIKAGRAWKYLNLIIPNCKKRIK